MKPGQIVHIWDSQRACNVIGTSWPTPTHFPSWKKYNIDKTGFWIDKCVFSLCNNLPDVGVHIYLSAYEQERVFIAPACEDCNLNPDLDFPHGLL